MAKKDFKKIKKYLIRQTFRENIQDDRSKLIHFENLSFIEFLHEVGIRQCRIRLVMHFLFLETSFEILGYVSEMIFFSGAVTYGAQEQFHFWGQKISRYPRLKSFLGAVTYGAQEEIFLCEKSKVFERCFKK